MASAPDFRVATAIAVMERRMAEPWRVEDLATIATLSPSRFAHLFQAETGTSPLRYLQDLRMERARCLLERTTVPVRDVMHQVGCRDLSHFSRQFSKRFGLAPRAYRRACFLRPSSAVHRDNNGDSCTRT
jgi:AraC family transcriptional regulator, arabinose operon regulatory protein